jgi:predicted transcriptional regulator
VPPRQSVTLTEAELRIMNVLWQRGSGTVQQVLDTMPGKQPLDGRVHIYVPVVERQEATRSEIHHLVSRFFKDSHEQLVLNILEDHGMDPEELTRLRQMLERSGRK